MNDPRRALVEAVARGEISPEEAAEQLAAVEARTSGPDTPAPAPPPVVNGSPALDTVRVRADFGEVRIYGDASVTGATADGPHSAYQDGSALVINAQLAGLGGFVFGRRGRIRVNPGGHLEHRLRAVGARHERIAVRMNPHLALELDCQAGDIRVDGVEGPIKCDVAAGDVRIDGFRSPIDIAVKAGQVRAGGVLDRGESRISCQAGQVRLELERGSSVRVRANARLGSVDFDDGSETALIGGAQERVVGGGAGTLDVDTTLGQVDIRSPR